MGIIIGIRILRPLKGKGVDKKSGAYICNSNSSDIIFVFINENDTTLSSFILLSDCASFS